MELFLNPWSIINVAKSLFCSSEYNLARILKARLSLPPDTAIANFSLLINFVASHRKNLWR